MKFGDFNGGRGVQGRRLSVFFYPVVFGVGGYLLFLFCSLAMLARIAILFVLWAYGVFAFFGCWLGPGVMGSGSGVTWIRGLRMEGHSRRVF